MLTKFRTPLALFSGLFASVVGVGVIILGVLWIWLLGIWAVLTRIEVAG